MRNLPRSGRSPWCRSVQHTRAAVRDFVGGASPEIRRLGSFAGYQQAAGYDPLLNNEPEFARTMAASVKQRIGSDFGDEEERPELTGPRCAEAALKRLKATDALVCGEGGAQWRHAQHTTGHAITWVTAKIHPIRNSPATPV